MKICISVHFLMVCFVIVLALNLITHKMIIELNMENDNANFLREKKLWRSETGTWLLQVVEKIIKRDRN